jgi:hypothetical protein
MSAQARSRRDWALFTMAGLASPLSGGSGGVRLGVQAACFRDLPLASGSDAVDALVQALAECGVRECELAPFVVEPAAFGGHASHHASVMPAQMMRRELRKWRLRTPLSYFESIGSRLQKAGVRVSAYNYSPDTTFSDEEIDRGFSMARALGAEILTASTRPELARRMAPFADKHGMAVAFSSLSEMSVSSTFRLHVDVGELAAGNIDPVAYVRDHHAEIASLYLTGFGGHGQDRAIRDVLHLLKREGWPIRACVKCQHHGDSTAIEEVKRCVAFARQALA